MLQRLDIDHNAETAAMRSFICLALSLAFGGTASAASVLEGMQGGWAMAGTDCATVFEKVGDEIRYRDHPGSSLDTGIIISARKIVGPNATCSAPKVSETGDHFSIMMTCADAVLSSTVSMSFRVIDATHFERFDPNFPEFSLEYTKCPL